jgi:hypothetical protein
LTTPNQMKTNRQVERNNERDMRYQTLKTMWVRLNRYKTLMSMGTTTVHVCQ